MLKPSRRHPRLSGFTIIELMTAISVLAILMAIAVPSLADWVRNNKVRTVANALQSGMRGAQSAALSRSQPVVLFLTNAKLSGSSTSFTAADNGKYWGALTIPGLIAGETAELLNSGMLGDAADGVSITGPAAICFNSLGRLTANTSPGPTSAACSLPSGTTESFDIGMTGAKRRLRVTVSIGGQVRMCDRDKDIAQHPDGCPT